MKTKLLALSLLFLGSLALAGQPAQTSAGTRGDGGTTPKADSSREGVDNSAINKRDNGSTEPTADQQKNAHSDVDLTAKIRRSIVGDKSLSTNAHNVKIIAANGIVVLRGPVASQDEKQKIEATAVQIAGVKNVRNQLEVAAQ